MSLSAMKNKTLLYYPVLETAHHYPNVDQLYKQYQVNKRIADKLFRKNMQDHYDFKWNTPTLKDYEDKWGVGKETAERDCNKHYPKTVEENKQILVDFLTLLQEHQIKAALVIYPVTQYYAEYFSEAIEQEFHTTVQILQRKFHFQLIDAFRSPLFNDNDFADVSHLNWKGAEKFTELLNQHI